jgi:N-acetyl-alpha-D-muramate 1-phosphate uridylyltransferase
VTDVRLAALVFAAGSGTRLRPLTHLRPKVLCPVGGTPLVDHALERATSVTNAVAVNIHHGAKEIATHIGERAHVSVEAGEALETAGAIGVLRGWIDGRDLLTLNGDTWHPELTSRFVRGWDRERVRLAVVEDRSRPDFGAYRYVGAALIPWRDVRQQPTTRAGLYRTLLAPAHEAGRLDLWESTVAAYDCGTPAEYLAANLAACGTESLVAEGAVVTGEATRCVIGAGAHVAGRITGSVIWPGAAVGPDERLVGAVRAELGFTVHVADYDPSDGTAIHRGIGSSDRRGGSMSDQSDEPIDEEESLGPQHEADEETQADAGLTGAEGPRDEDDDRVGNED